MVVENIVVWGLGGMFLFFFYRGRGNIYRISNRCPDEQMPPVEDIQKQLL